MKKILSIILSVVMLASVLLTGCAKKEEPKQGGTSNGGQTTLRISWWGSQDRHDRTLKVIKMFEEKNPGVKIEPEFTSWDGYWEKMSANAAGNNLPDVMQHDYQYLKQYVDKGLLIPLDEYVSSKKLDLSAVDENSIVGGKVNGKLYAINLGTNSLVTIYDPEIYAKAGIKEPTPDRTWEQYIQDVITIKQKTGVYGDGAMPGNYFHGFKHYLRQKGFNVYSADGKKLGYEDDKLFVDFFNMELQMYKAGALPSPAERLEVKSPEDELIVKKKAAMSEVNANQIIAMAKAANRPLKMALLPKAKDQVKEGQFLKPSQFFTVTKDSKNKDMAVKFIDFFTNDIEANKVLLAERGVPISSKVREGIKGNLTDVQKQMFEYVDLVIKNSSPIDPPEPAKHGEIDKLLKDLEQQMLFGKITPEEAAKKFRKTASDLLAQ